MFKVFLDISIGGKRAGRIEVGLFGRVVPKTVANFVGLVTHSVSYIAIKSPHAGFICHAERLWVQGVQVPPGDQEVYDPRCKLATRQSVKPRLGTSPYYMDNWRRTKLNASFP